MISIIEYNRSCKLLSWLSKRRKTISLNYICKQIGYDRNNLYKALNGKRNLPSSYHDALEKELIKIGYAPKE